MASILDGSAMRCSFGLSGAHLAVVPPDRPANIYDFRPHNIRTFGMCSSPANPAVAATLMASRGAINRAGCHPICGGTWTPGRLVPGSQPMVGNPPAPAIDERSILTCVYGGLISFVPSQPGSFGAQGSSNIGSSASANSAASKLATQSQSKPPPSSGGQGA